MTDASDVLVSVENMFRPVVTRAARPHLVPAASSSFVWSAVHRARLTAALPLQTYQIQNGMQIRLGNFYRRARAYNTMKRTGGMRTTTPPVPMTPRRLPACGRSYEEKKHRLSVSRHQLHGGITAVRLIKRSCKLSV